jgi:hypothetical protein
VLTALVYAILLGAAFPPTVGDTEFYLWAGWIAVGPSLVSAWAVSCVRLRSIMVRLVAAPAVGLLLAYVLALFTYGTGAEDGTVWRGIGGGVLGLVSAIAACVLRLGRPLSQDSSPAA